MNKTNQFLTVQLLVLFLCPFSSLYAESKVEYGDGFIVFEAESAPFSSNYWVVRTPSDAQYEKYVTASSQSKIAPVNNTYLEYIGPWNGDGASSAITYTFTCQSTGDYQLAMRLHQPLKEGEKGDARNDVYVNMSGDFDSASKFTKHDLESKHKFWGRGVNQWGTAQYLEHSGSFFPVYHLTAGKTYTFTMFGRSTGACIDYILFFKKELRLGVTNKDLAQQNPALYRPGGTTELGTKVAKVFFDKTSTYLSRIGESKQLVYHLCPSTAVDKSLLWESSNPSVVSVDQTGRITAEALGKATITATTNDGGLIAKNIMEVGAFIETFDTYESFNSALNTFVGDNEFSLKMRASNTNRMNTNNAIQFNRGMVGILAEAIPGGISNFCIECKHLYSEDKPRTLELLINNQVVGTSTQTTKGVYRFEVNDINVGGTFSLKVRNATEDDSKSFTVMVDNITWTPFEGATPVNDYKTQDQNVSVSVSNGMLTVNGKMGEVLKQCELFNAKGTLIGQWRVDATQFLTPTIVCPKGVYLLKIHTRNSTVVRKIVL